MDTMGTKTRALYEALQEQGDPLELLGKEFELLNCTDEIKQLVFENDAFKKMIFDKGIQYKTFEDIDAREYRRFLNKLKFTSYTNLTNWLGLNPNKNSPTLERANAIKILFALRVRDIARANRFILRSCGDEAYVFYSRDYKDLIYKFCLQNGYSISDAEHLIKKHSYIERSSYMLLQCILSEWSDINFDMIQLVWETLCGGSVEISKDEGRKAINAFCIQYGIDAEIRTARERTNIVAAINKYDNQVTINNSYNLLKSILLEFSVCDDVQTVGFIEAFLCDKFYQNEISSGKRVIGNFCETSKDIITQKYNAKIVKQETNINDAINLLQSILLEVFVCDEAQITELIGDIETKKKTVDEKINELICGFCNRVEKIIVQKYTDKFEDNKSTSSFNEDTYDLKNKAGLEKYLRDNQNQFSMYRRTAYEKFRHYFDLLLKEYGIPQGIEDQSYKYYEAGKPVKDEDGLYDELNLEGIIDEIINDGINQDDATLTIIQRTLTAPINKSEFAPINKSELKDMKNFKEQIRRRYFIWLFMSTWGTNDNYENDYRDPRDAIECLNEELADCGFRMLHSRSPFDYVVLNTMFYCYRVENLELGRKVLSDEENEKLEKETFDLVEEFSPFDEFKKIIKTFYDIELE